MRPATIEPLARDNLEQMGEDEKKKKMRRKK